MHAGRGILAFRLKNEEEEITVILNSNEKTRNVDIGSGTYETLYEDLKVYKDGKNIVSTKGKNQDESIISNSFKEGWLR